MRQEHTNSELPEYRQPPKLGERFLSWFCKPELAEAISGDLIEDFNDHLSQYGHSKARIYYWYSLIRFLRPFAVKKLFKTRINNIMFKNDLRSASRNLVKHKLFSFINIVGLGISMAICLLSISFITEIYSYDSFNTKGDRIFRLTSQYQRFGQPVFNLASSSVYAGKRVQELFPGIEETTLLTYDFGGAAKTGNDDIVSIKGLWASGSFFSVFSYPLIEGNPQTALKEPYSIVLTEEAAIKIFGRTSVVGETVSFDGSGDYVVTGLLENTPTNSHLQFEALGSYSTKEIQERENPRFESWASPFLNYTYLLLSDADQRAPLEQMLERFSQEENAPLTDREIQLGLQPLNEVVVGTPLMNGIGFAIEEKTVLLVGGLTLIILLSACFNYANLALNRALRRMREIGIRKTMGATTKAIFRQFLVEALLISQISLAFAYLIFELIKQQVLSFDPEIQQSVSFDTSPKLYVYFVLFALIVGTLAGSFPALMLSKVGIVKGLKGTVSKSSSLRVFARKSLLLLQYALSLAFILAAIISNNQYKYALNYDLGYETEQIINIPLNGNDPQTAMNEFAKIPEVEAISRSFLTLGTGRYVEYVGRYDKTADSAVVHYNIVDDQYLPLHDFELIAGENFRPAGEASSGNRIVVNETLLRQFGLGTPAEAIDELFTLSNTNYRIVGVVRDFHSLSLSEEIVPFAFIEGASLSRLPWKLNLKVNTHDLNSTMAKMEQAWNRLDTSQPLEAAFYGDQIKSTYSNFLSILSLVSALALVAISIATLGLLGMAVYTAETKLKEIGIRKILGAPLRHLSFIMTKGLLFPILLSILIALPVTYWVFSEYLLNEIAYRADIGLSELLSSVAIVLLLSILTIGSQTLKTTMANPADTLRSE